MYGGLEGSTMGETTCSFHKYMRDGRGSEVLRRGLAALAKLPPPQGRVQVGTIGRKGETEEGDPAKETSEACGGEEKEKRRAVWRKGDMSEAAWTRGQVEAQRLFFNPWYTRGTKLTGRSSLELEVEAASFSILLMKNSF